ncbi:MAG: ABC-2 family transporter protein, partial [Caldilineaceae bacterium]|nr:ABC-2 family transporter protein [Caldilineaceae bacterium]
FFGQFGTVRSYNVGDVYLLFAVVALGFGLALTFGANTGPNLAELIAQGRLDYYLVLPRPLLLHVICSRMGVSSIGDVLFGLTAFFFVGRLTLVDFGLFVTAGIASALIFAGFGVIVGSLAFYMGNAVYVSGQVANGMLTFALYPHTLFGGMTRFMLYTLLPAAFVGAVPAQIVKTRDGMLLLGVLGVAALVWLLALGAFYYGLRRYESGSALNVNV